MGKHRKHLRNNHNNHNNHSNTAGHDNPSSSGHAQNKRHNHNHDQTRRRQQQQHTSPAPSNIPVNATESAQAFTNTTFSSSSMEPSTSQQQQQQHQQKQQQKQTSPPPPPSSSSSSSQWISSNKNNRSTSSTQTNLSTTSSLEFNSSVNENHPFHSFTRILICCLFGIFLGYGVGSGYLTGMYGSPSPWRTALGIKIRNSKVYDMMIMSSSSPSSPLSSSSRRNGRNHPLHHGQQSYHNVGGGGGGSCQNNDVRNSNGNNCRNHHHQQQQGGGGGGSCGATSTTTTTNNGRDFHSKPNKDIQRTNTNNEDHNPFQNHQKSNNNYNNNRGGSIFDPNSEQHKQCKNRQPDAATTTTTSSSSSSTTASKTKQKRENKHNDMKPQSWWDKLWYSFIAPFHPSYPYNIHNHNHKNIPPPDEWADPRTLQSIRNLPTPGVSTGQYDSSHPMIYAALRESIIREKGGYVHPDLGILSPAPCGASRGLGMVRDDYRTCQEYCFPGKKAKMKMNTAMYDWDGRNKTNHQKQPEPQQPQPQQQKQQKQKKQKLQEENEEPPFEPEEILLKIPLVSQLTRKVALHTLLPLLPHEVRHRLPLEDLDDSILLALLLAHERGRNRESKYQAYIATLPLNPTCGYSPHQRLNALEVIRTYEQELGLDVNGWVQEIRKASDYAERIAGGLARDYGNYLAVPVNTSPFQLIQWGLCTVASRAVMGSDLYGRWRLVPLLDVINHDEDAGEILELGVNYEDSEDLSDNAGNIKLDVNEDDAGAMVVRSMRYWRPKHLKKGQELMINYNIPHYSPLDWFINQGFIPIERATRWTRLENVLPRLSRRQYAEYADSHPHSSKKRGNTHFNFDLESGGVTIGKSRSNSNVNGGIGIVGGSRSGIKVIQQHQLPEL